MALTSEDVVTHLGNLTVMQLCELNRELEAKWGVKAVPAPAPAPVGTALPAAPPEQTEFSVVLQSVDPPQRIAAIKLLREVNGLTLADAKDVVEHLPKTIKEGLSKDAAQEILGKFVAAGVKAVLQ